MKLNQSWVGDKECYLDSSNRSRTGMLRPAPSSFSVYEHCIFVAFCMSMVGYEIGNLPPFLSMTLYTSCMTSDHRLWLVSKGSSLHRALVK